MVGRASAFKQELLQSSVRMERPQPRKRAEVGSFRV